ncbi:MAG: hypothetical protein NT105_19810 [Verrucomicrobia bacterium]|nr:hypothetical protein [Verrucomicrobiota bacterium]
MKRPIGLYLAAAWYSFFLLGQIAILHQKEEFILLEVASFALSAWLVIGLIQLKPISRWICVVFLSYPIAMTLLAGIDSASMILHTPEFRHRTLALIAVAAGSILALTPSVLSIWYLSRRSFREFARQFVEERQKQKLERPRAPSN